MALNGSVSVEATRSGNDDLVFYWEAVQDQNTMTSTVSWKMELVAHAYGRIDQGTPQPWTVTIDGQAFSGTASVNIANNETKELASGKVVLTHNEDGTRSFAFTFSQELNITWGASSDNPIYIGAVTGEGSGELDPLEAPELKPDKFPIKKWLAGLIAALCSPRRVFPQREPIGYLYGHVAKEGETIPEGCIKRTINDVDYVGIVAPKLPEIDTEKYPLVWINVTSHNTDGYVDTTIYAVSSNATYWEDERGWLWFGSQDPNNPVDFLHYYVLEGDAWTYKWEYTGVNKLPVYPPGGASYSRYTYTNPWSNFDFVYDGAVWLTETDPIPIYE